MSGTELFGVAAVTLMVITYALEERGSAMVLAFSVSCLAAAIYAILIQSWPFAGVETIWSAIAFRRWLRRRTLRNGA
jgi:hypothetical protein